MEARIEALSAEVSEVKKECQVRRHMKHANLHFKQFFLHISLASLGPVIALCGCLMRDFSIFRTSRRSISSQRKESKD